MSMGFDGNGHPTTDAGIKARTVLTADTFFNQLSLPSTEGSLEFKAGFFLWLLAH